MNEQRSEPVEFVPFVDADAYIRQTLLKIEKPSPAAITEVFKKVSGKAEWDEHRLKTKRGSTQIELVRSEPWFRGTADRIQTLELLNSATSSRITLSDLMPSNEYKLFSLDSRWTRAGDGNKIDYTSKEISIHDPWTPGQLLTLSHEAGHARQFDAMDSPNQQKVLTATKNFNHGLGNSQITNEDLALILWQEIDAWEFALGKIKPFLDEGSTPGLMSLNDADVIRRRSLQTYKAAITEIKRYFRASLGEL